MANSKLKDLTKLGVETYFAEKLDLLIDSVKELLPTASGAPASAVAAGKPGQIAFDATHIYLCIADNSWVRATLAAW